MMKFDTTRPGNPDSLYADRRNRWVEQNASEIASPANRARDQRRRKGHPPDHFAKTCNATRHGPS
jgi:hypothetical protein